MTNPQYAKVSIEKKDGIAVVTVNLPTKVFSVPCPMHGSAEVIDGHIEDAMMVMHQSLGLAEAKMRLTLMARGVDYDNPPWK